MRASEGKKALLVGLGVSALAALVSRFSPVDLASTLVAAVFCGATYLLVLRKDEATIEAFGVALGGVLVLAPLSWQRIVRDTLGALGWAALLCVITLPPYWLGYVLWFDVDASFELPLSWEFANAAAAHLLMIALPEELFYRGYLHSALDRAFPPKYQLWGATLGWSTLIGSAIFALGHVLSTPHPARLAVFFPSLLFAFLRARTGGVGSGILYHALCNIFASFLARGYGLA